LRDLQGKVICVTGASRGIGNALANAFAEQGANMLLLARAESLLDTASQLAPVTNVLARQCDVSRFADVHDAILAGIERWGRIDVLVNAAGILGATGEIWRSDPEAWASAIEVNLIGTYNTMRAVLPQMVERRAGKIINFAGGGAAYGYPMFSAYGASKAAVVRLTETVALECAPHSVKVNVIAPGAIDTDMLQAVRAAGGEVRSVGTMDQVVDIVLFLASEASDHLSGRFIHAKDPYREFPVDMPGDLYTLRRVQP
jgi:3-oxoacyl-[acyl-carrier protein] reductase